MVSRVNGFFQSVKKGIIARNAILIMGKPTSRKEGINERATFSIRNTRTTRIERMVESGGCRTVGRTVSVSRRSYLCGSRDASPYLARYALALRLGANLDGSGLFIREGFDSLFAVRAGACRIPREELVARLTRPTRLLFSSHDLDAVLPNFLTGTARNLTVERLLVVLRELLARVEALAQTAVRYFLLFGAGKDRTLGLHGRMCAPLTFLAFFVTCQMECASCTVDATIGEIEVFLVSRLASFCAVGRECHILQGFRVTAGRLRRTQHPCTSRTYTTRHKRSPIRRFRIAHTINPLSLGKSLHHPTSFVTEEQGESGGRQKWRAHIFFRDGA